MLGRFLFFLTGFFALTWFLIRVVPKPQRAAYPCQRVAMPLASAFVLWLLGIGASAKLLRTAADHMSRRRVFVALFLGVSAALLFVGTQALMPSNDAIGAPPPLSGNPVGVGVGVHPGRVVWAYDPDATDWGGEGSGDRQYATNCTDAALVAQMFDNSIRMLAGEDDLSAAWDALFKNLNERLGRGSVGYQPGETIAIKINLTTTSSSSSVDSTTWEQKSYIDRTGPSPALAAVLLDHLINIVGVAEEDIAIGDPTCLMPAHIYNWLHDLFPNVVYLDYVGGPGDRVPVSFGSVPFNWSTSDADGLTQDYLPTYFGESTYFINNAILKSHMRNGITLCAKNHYGSLFRKPTTAGYLQLHEYLPMLSDKNPGTPGMGHYRTLVDLMGHRDLGGKTVLYLIDGLFGGDEWSSTPSLWTMPPFNGDWPSSIFVSQDPVAIDSVGYDFVLQQWPDRILNDGMGGGGTDYLVEAAQADNPPSGTFYDPEHDGTNMTSLGVHEHWNNVIDKQYSRNLGASEGIELVSINSAGEPLQEPYLYLDAGTTERDVWFAGTTPMQQYQVLWSPTLIDPVWEVMDTFRTETSAANWVDTNASDQGFYCLKRIPSTGALLADVPPTIDGDPDDICWSNAAWQAIDQTWIPYGDVVDSSDFSGRFKAAWSDSENVIYFLAEIVDDVFVDGYTYPQNTYPNYDVLEIFIDENRSGGNHVFDTATTDAENAFSYHITANEPADGGTVNTAVVCDLAGTSWGSSTIPNYFNHFDQFALKKVGNTYYYEFALKVYDDTYQSGDPEASRVQLSAGKVLGLSVAYCDNDDPNEDPKTRDNFFGSVPVPAAEYNDHWKEAGGFGSLRLDGVRVNSASAPTAVAGSDVTVQDMDHTGYEEVTLDGSASSDDVGIVSWLWQSGGSTLGTNAVLVENFAVGVHTVVLTVEDADGQTDSDAVIVTVLEGPPTTPTADAGPDQSVRDSDGDGFASVTLDGSGSTDDVGVTAYSWATNGVQIATGVSPTVSLPQGVHTVELTVSDADLQTDTDAVTITVKPPALGEIVVQSSAGITSGTKATSSTSFSISNTGAAGDYLVISVATETRKVSTMTFNGTPMTNLYEANADNIGYVQFFGIETTALSGTVNVTFTGDVSGEQVFGCAFVSGVDAASPVRASGSIARSAGSGTTSLSLTYSASAAAGDCAFISVYQNGGSPDGSIDSVTPSDVTLVDGYVTGTFSGMVTYDAELTDGTYGNTVTFSGGTNRQVAGGIVLASE